MVSVPVIPGVPASDCVMPSTSSKAAATCPPCTQPGGPSYAEPNTPRPTMAPSSTLVTMGGAIGLAKPMIGLLSKNACGSPELAVSAKPSNAWPWGNPSRADTTASSAVAASVSASIGAVVATRRSIAARMASAARRISARRGDTVLSAAERQRSIACCMAFASSAGGACSSPGFMRHRIRR